MKRKNGQAPRPKYHLIFPTHILESASEYSYYAKKLVSMFPQLYFDSAVTGAAQLNFGVENPVVSYVDGKTNLTEYILSNHQEIPLQTPDTKPKDTAVIPQGQRNNTLHKFALSVLTKYGVTDTVYNLYLKESQKTTLLHERSWDHVDRFPVVYEILGITDKNYQSLIRKWTIQTIAVLFNSDDTPVTAEGVLVLQGKQGIGKTQFFRHLAIKDSFFKGGATLDMTNKDSLMSATKVWICELGEIDSTTKKEQSALKAFLTEQTDRYREPYARCETVRPRRTSFCGTVNPQDYLRDETGNRRFWTIPIEKIDLKRIFELSPEWYAQFWRQILTIYKRNPKGYLLTENEKDFINRNNQQYEQLLFGEDEFLTCADFQTDKALWKWPTAAEIAKALNEEFRSLHISSARIGKLLGRIEEREHIVFERKAVKGKRLILCPPIAKTATNNTCQISDLPEYRFRSLQILSDEESVSF